MNWFNNRKILTKVLFLVGISAVFIAGVGYIGYQGIYELNQRSNEQNITSHEVDVGNGLLQSIILMDSSVNDIAADSSPENVRSNQETVRTERANFEKDITELENTSSKEQKEHLTKIKSLYDAYIPYNEKVFAEANKVDPANLSSNQTVIEAMNVSERPLNELVTELQTYVALTLEESKTSVESANATYQTSFHLLIATSIGALVLSFIFGFWMSVYNISRPVNKVVDVLQKMIAWNLNVDIQGADRKDEVGDVARAAMVFKEALQALDRSQAIIEFEMSGTIVTANANFLATVGYSLDEIKGKHHSMFADEAYKNSVDYKNFWDSLNKGVYQAGEYRRVGKNNKEVWIQASYNPVIGPDGKPYKVVKYASDITAQKMRQKKIEVLISAFDTTAAQTVSTVSSASTQLSQTAESMSKVADDTNKQSVEVASASEQASHNVQSVASAAEEMAATVQEISKQISLSNGIVRDAMDKAETADNSSKELVEMSKSVGAIATLIEDIAGQINLLALNATIESARSGEAGKGFAVVANEVKNLATQTAKATEQIRQQLEAVQTTASGVAGSLGEVREAISKVNESSAAIAAAVEEQSAATQEIVSNMSTATQGVEQINGGIFAIKGGTDSTTSATRQVLEAARMLSSQAEKMDQEVKTFLHDILAA